MKTFIFFWAIFFLIQVSFVSAEDLLQEFKIKRANVFAFTKKPEIKEEKNKTTISFAVKDFCDVTVAIENSDGKIFRHLVSGVLGAKAPEPFQKNSLEQTIVWDNKDDQDLYPKDNASLRVRVSLGVQADYEKDLDYTPYRRICDREILCASPEGVYVFMGETCDYLKLYGHDGSYQKTIFPFPASQIKKVIGLKMEKTIDGREVLKKESNYRQTFLSSGYNDDGSGGNGWGGINTASTILAVKGKRIALGFEDLNRLSTEGNTGGLPLKGPSLNNVSMNFYIDGGTPRHHGENINAGGNAPVGPSSAAFSPDGKTLYLTGYMWQSLGADSLQAVYKINYETNDKMSVFVGVATLDGHGSDDTHFSVPTSVDTDIAGNVYVSDFLNNRVQIFEPSGKLLKSLSVNNPAKVLVHQKTGEIFVFSWGCKGVSNALTKKLNYYKEKIPEKIFIFTAFPEMKLKKELNFPDGVIKQNRLVGPEYHITLDSWTEFPTLWMAGQSGIDPTTKLSGILIIQLKNEKWEVIGNLTQNAKKDGALEFGQGVNRKLYFNPQNEKLYVQNGGRGGASIVELDPITAQKSWLKLPFGFYDDIDFDINGLLYMRTYTSITRWQINPLHEVPFDYGQDLSGHANFESPPAVSAIMIPGAPTVCGYQGGMSVNVNGDIIASCHYNNPSESKKRDNNDTNQYKPMEYPGRHESSMSNQIHIWDKYGKLKSDDVIGGADKTDGVFIDKNLNIYLTVVGNRLIDGKKIDNGLSQTLIKFNKGSKGKFLTKGGVIPLSPSEYPKRQPEINCDLGRGGQWVENYEWIYGGIGFAGFNGPSVCACWFTRFKLDYFARTFVPAPMLFEVHMLDSSGNLILKMGQYGNDDSKGKNSLEPLGGDEIGLFHPCFVATDTDHRVYIFDVGTQKIISVKLKYAVDETLALKIIK